MDINNEQLEITSAIFFAVINPPEKQKDILNYCTINTDSTVNDSKISNTKLMPNNTAKKTSKRGRIRRKSPRFVSYSSQLEDFFPEIRLTDNPYSKLKTTKKTIKNNATKHKKLVTSLHPKASGNKSKTKQKGLDNPLKISPLTNFIEPDSNSSKVNRKTIYEEKEPFPFTNISEWLLWHEKYPELAYVREVISSEDIPDKSKVYYVNFAGEPVFFDHNWRILGSDIDISTVRQPPTHADWEVFGFLTDGLSLLLSDIWNILFQTPQGLPDKKVKRYALVQFALRVLYILGFVDLIESRWYSLNDAESLKETTTELDSFIINQSSIDTYESLFILGHDVKLLAKLVSLDLLFSKSSFLSPSILKISEDKKIVAIKNHKHILSSVLSELKKISVLEKTRSANLLSKLLTS